MESSRPVSPRRNDPPPYKPPASGDRIFYLFLTATATMIVYKSFPKNIRGMASLAVASFGIYHSFGLTCKCIQETINKFFGGPGGGSGGGFGGNWGCLPQRWGVWDIPLHQQRRQQSSVAGHDRGPRQEKRRDRESDRRDPPPSDASASYVLHETTAVAVDRGPRQSKRRYDAYGNEIKSSI